MTLDQAVALSLVDNLPRQGLTERLQAADPELLEVATSLTGMAHAIRARAARAGIHVTAWNDPAYPPWLLMIPDCPPALWYRGSLDCLHQTCVAIVGSRAASMAGLETAHRLGRDLAAKGITVVSGLARGADSAAHRGALETGCTAAVLGSGLDHVYPSEHETLARQVAGRGVVLSEYPPAARPLPYHFPMRNRLISGLSRAIVVIEASDKSGSLITASCALEQGRDVMAVPGNVLSGRNRGGHALIRDGAKIVETADDIVEELGMGGRATGNLTSSSDCSMSSEDPVLGRMTAGEPCGIDELAARSGLDPDRLLPRLAELELTGFVRRTAGGRFVRAGGVSSANNERVSVGRKRNV
jgi:DNA processing protein